MVTHVEKIINNCLQHIPLTEPFNCWFVLNSLGESAYRNMQFPSLNSQSDTTEKNALLMSNYLLAKRFAEKIDDNQLVLTEKGRRLKDLGEIYEYECREWWEKHWIKVTTVITLIITALGVFAKLK